ncbi:hypothetical protein P9869_42095 [Streptomyces ossamyceticus]|nr:hypothetical protein [Streptomyces ossamyceticus]
MQSSKPIRSQVGDGAVLPLVAVLEVTCETAELREETGDRDGAEDLYQQAADDGDPFALYRLAQKREEAGDWKGAEDLLRQAGDDDDANIVYHLARMREQAGDRDSAEALVRQAADDADPSALYRLAELTGDFAQIFATRWSARPRWDAHAAMAMSPSFPDWTTWRTMPVHQGCIVD